MSLNPKRRRRFHRSGRIPAGGLILLPLISVSIMLLMYFKEVDNGSPDGKGKSYIETVIDSKKSAQELVSEIEIFNLHKDIRMHAITHNDKYPSLERLLDFSSVAYKLLSSPPQREPLCIYIEGQSVGSNFGNVLVYQAGVGEDESGLVLLKGGLVQMMTGDQIAEAVQHTEVDLAGR